MDRQRSSSSGPQRAASPTALATRLAVMAAGVAILLGAVASSALAQGPTDSPQPAEATPTVTKPQADIPFPTTLAGVPLDVQTYTGPEWLDASATGDPGDAAYIEQTEALLASLGKSIDDLTVKSALAQPTEGTPVVIAGVRIADTEARTYIRELVRVLLGDLEQPELLMRLPLTSQWVLRVVDAETPGVYPRTVVLDGDTAWIIGGDEEYVQDLLSQLPLPEGPTTVEPEVLSGQLPVALGGRRRAGLVETLEPLLLPTLAESFGPAFEDWLLDLYLDEGIRPTDIIGADAWWGLRAPEESVEIEGYLVPGASPEAVERLLSDAGIVWVVTDHVGEPQLAEEAIAALP